jgi:hypothetical protein
MTSIVKLRVINFIGCLLFAAFAYFIDSYPTMLMNLGIACINVYFLYQLYRNQEQFKLLIASTESEYFAHFLEVNREEIEQQRAIEDIKQSGVFFYMLRNNVIAGVLAGDKNDNGVFDIKLDFVIPEYRDFKLGKYYFESNTDEFKERGIVELKTDAKSKNHQTYLEAVGFVRQSESASIYSKIL